MHIKEERDSERDVFHPFVSGSLFFLADKCLFLLLPFSLPILPLLCSNFLLLEGEEGDAWTLSALQRLSLQRKGRNGVHLDGNKNAKGIQGLHFGGRAGLAKKNLASLAPEGLPGTGARKYGWNGFESLDVDKMQSSKRNKRLAGQGVEAGGVEVLGAEETPSRPSKLAALAASRGKPSTTTSTPLAPNTSAEGKPLSKLQQKMQANLLARQQKNQPLNQEDLLQRQREEEDERNRLLHLPTGDPIATLFPVASTSGASPDQSSFGFVLRSSKKEDLAVPGGSPFETIMHHLEAFMRPSPDDIVLKAREGTNLAKT